jgi:thymidylate kinase
VIRNALPSPQLGPLVDALETRADPGIVGVEGSVYAGKSTLCRDLARRLRAVVLEEHSRIPALRATIGSPWPAGPAEQVARQRAILSEEASRADRVRRSGLGAAPLVLDRTLLSPIAYLYARVAAGDASEATLAAVLDSARDLLESGRALVPARIIYLSVDEAECRRRASATVEWPARGTETFLMLSRTIHAQRAFFESLASRMSRIALEL